MGLLDNQSSELYYTGELNHRAKVTEFTAGGDWYTYSLNTLAQPFLWRCGRDLTVSDIRVTLITGNAELLTANPPFPRELYNFTITNNVLNINYGDTDSYFDELSELDADGVIKIELLEENITGGYRYTSLADIVNSFMVGYVGDGKLINNVAKSDVIFHARRGLQEFSYDVFKTIKSQEVELSPSLSIPMPQDYVSYTKISYIDSNGIKRIIYPTSLTINPTESLAQEEDYEYIYDSDGNILTADSTTEERWEKFNTNNITNDLDSSIVDNTFNNVSGKRFGLEPKYQQINGYFTINERTGSFNFSSDLSGKVIVIEYVSDSLGTDAEMKVHKFTEEALYKHIAYNILAAKRNISEYIVQRYRKERRAALRNAKLRLSKLNLEEMTQIMRGKSKQIKN